MKKTVKRPYKKPVSQGIALKKQFGQHFLRDQTVVDTMLSAIKSAGKNVFEIGCGDGFLTRAITKQKPAKLWVFEIDEEWATLVGKELASKSYATMFHENFLDVDNQRFAADAPWILFSNLPYQVIFPILKKIQSNRSFIKEGVVMVQEEVAQKIVKTRGRGYGFISLFFQHFFEWKLLVKIAPEAFFPPPSVYSRLIQFKVKETIPFIPNEERFWAFVKQCFLQPRRTLRNNLVSTAHAWEKIDDRLLELRAQQMNFDDFLNVWNVLQVP